MDRIGSAGALLISLHTTDRAYGDPRRAVSRRSPSSRPVLHTAPCFLEDLNLTRKRPRCPGGLVASILSLLTGSVRLPLEGCSFFYT